MASLMEVYQIRYVGNDEVKPIDQIGTIKLISDYHVQYLYNVQEVMPWNPSIKDRDPIMVNVGSPTPRSASLYIEFDLFRSAYKGTIMVDWEETFSGCVSSWDERIESRDGLGDVVVYFGLMPNATVAEVEVKLLDTSACEDVYGVISASNSAASSLPICQSLLFLAEADNGVYVDDDDGIIPLSKSRVAVPLDTTLSLQIVLNCDGEDYSAILEFDAEKEGEFIQLDDPEAPTIQVKVTWDADRASINRTIKKCTRGLRNYILR
ncbi:uncharacterized protein LOC141677665 [Apium graveolens]|uniref:uncharacterized protein LOC141677665 n=1 Tax=Apium graveolens TaxID=4045 RepID=UPI003D7A3EFD